jgi:drug/metabolite transporter (DMT)-like permease
VNIYFKLVVTAIIWGGTFVAGRIIASNMGAFSAAFWRFVIASIVLLFLVDREGGLPRVKKEQIPAIFLLGLTGVFAYNAFFFFGLQLITASRAALIIALNPVAIVLFAALFSREKLSLFQLSGVLISLLGATIVIAKGNPLDLLSQGIGRGELLIFGCVLSWATYTIVGKKIVKEMSVLATSTYACAIGAILLLIPALIEYFITVRSSFHLNAWLGIFYLAIFGSAIAFCWYYEGVSKIGAARAGVFINLVPPSAVILARVMLQESIDLSVIFGGLLTILGVILTNIKIFSNG